MKKLLSLLALCAMTMVSCEMWFVDVEPKKEYGEPTETPGDNPGDEPEQPEQPEIEFQLTSEPVVEISAKGGECVLTYAITNPDDTLAVEVAANVSWISESDALNAAANTIVLYVEANQSVEPRSAEVVVTYGEFKANVIVNQAADDELLSYLSGIYYGSDYGDSYNYSVVLATAESVFDVVTGDHYLSEGNTYLFLDLYASEASAEYNVKFRVPEGEYVLDLDDTCVAGTLGAQYTYLYYAVGEGEEIAFESGKVTVSKDSIAADLVDAEGKEYHYYTLATSVDNASLFKGSGKVGELSTLTEDLVINFDEPSLYAECYYDYYVVGKDLWMVYIDDYTTGHSVVMELLVPMGEAPVGVFPVSNDLSKERLALPGFADGYGETWWSWYLLYDGNDIVGEAPIVSGSLEIVDDEVGTHTATFSFKDDKGNAISGSCTDFYQGYEGYGILSAKRRAELPARK